MILRFQFLLPFFSFHVFALKYRWLPQLRRDQTHTFIELAQLIENLIIAYPLPSSGWNSRTLPVHLEYPNVSASNEY